MTTITTEKNLITLINVFTVAPENQQRLVDHLAEATQQIMRHLSGYISYENQNPDQIRYAPS